jgi:uncharacterized protein (TIGR03118 family)
MENFSGIYANGFNGSSQWYNPSNGTPLANQIKCNPCSKDPMYNPPPCPPPCAQPCGQPCVQICNNACGCSKKRCKKRCSKNNCKKESCLLPVPQCPPCESKDLCPLKSFCDPGLSNTCANLPIVDPQAPRRAVTTWKLNYLVANRVNLAAHTDPELINPWGIAIYNNQIWVVNGSSDLITNYDLFGNRLLGAVTIRDAYQNSSFPTGIAINCGGNFSVTNGNITRSSLFITASEHGTVNVYNPLVNAQTAYLVLNTQLTGEISVFRGLAVTNNTLYLANFFQGHIDVFDSSYNRLLGYNFIDNDSSDPIPLDFTPSNIVHIGCYLYVLYARKDPNITVTDLPGPGHGFISVYNLDGSFVRRFTSRGVLNSPWAMIPAPCECGFPPGSFLVGNNGDGRINIFDCNGRFVGPLLGSSGLPISIEGLWGLAPHYTDFNEIFWTSAPDQNIDGYLGSLTRDQVIYF